MKQVQQFNLHTPSMSLLATTLTAAVVGVGTGVIASTFRLVLQFLDTFRTRILQWAGDFGVHGLGGLLIVILTCALCATIAAAMVRFWEPVAEGSGIPRVEAIVRGDVGPSRMTILPVKFIGGLFAIGSGLALGREGPSVHMGASVAVITNHFYRRNKADLRILIAAGAAAGLTTAFSAPLAGAVFVLEELVKRFEARMTVAVLTASGTAFIMVHYLLGDGVNFPLPPLALPQVKHAPLVLAVGLIAGIAAVAYNWTLMRGLKFVDGSRIPAPVRAGIIGAMIGLIGWFGPGLVGGGDNLTQAALLGHGTIAAAIGIFVARFAIAVISYCALTPGGLFAPMLVLGAEIGLLVGLASDALFPGWGPSPGGLAVIGMAAFFASSVRAPVTGLVLATEMTGAVGLLPPLLGACAVAMMVAEMLNSQPIYDSLAARSARGVAANKAARAGL